MWWLTSSNSFNKINNTMIFVLELPHTVQVQLHWTLLLQATVRLLNKIWDELPIRPVLLWKSIRHMLEMCLHVIFTVRTVYSDPIRFQKTTHVLEMHDGIKTTQLVVYRFMVISPLCKTTLNHFNNLISLTYNNLE